MNRFFYTAGVILLVVLGGCDKGKDLPPAEILTLFQAVESGDTEALKKALDTGVSPDVHIPDSGYLIFEATAFGNKHALQMLIDAGANVNAKEEEGNGPLIVAMLGGGVRRLEFYCVPALIQMKSLLGSKLRQLL